MVLQKEYLISPDGVLIPLEDNYDEAILRHPENFGFELLVIERYRDEQTPMLALDQSDIISGLVSRGWAHIRRENGQWRIMVARLSGSMRGTLRTFAAMVIRKDAPFAGNVVDDADNDKMIVMCLSTGKALDLNMRYLAGREAPLWDEPKQNRAKAPRLRVADIKGYVPQQRDRTPGPEETVARFLKRAVSGRKKVLLYLSAGARLLKEYDELQYDVVILSDQEFNGFEVRDSRTVLMACRNAETIQWLREAGVRVHCVLTLNDGCCEGGNNGCENTVERFALLAPVLRDGCLYVFTHTNYYGQIYLEEEEEYEDLYRSNAWFTGFTAEPADADARASVAPALNEETKVMKLKRVRERVR